MGLAQFRLFLLLLSGDVETNPGPPKRGPPGGRPKEPTKEEQMKALQDKVQAYEDKIDCLEKDVAAHKEEISGLKSTVSGMTGFEAEVKEMKAKMESISDVYGDLQEKMHDVDKAIKNNLLFYGLVPEYLPEMASNLTLKIHNLFKFNLGISRQLSLSKVARLTTGPEIRGCRPVLVAFTNFQDREEVLSKSKLLKTANIYVSEDLSRKTRENRHELSKYMRFVKRKAPHKKCVIRYDKLYIDNQPYAFDEIEGKVVRYIPLGDEGTARALSPSRRTDSRQDRTESSLSRAVSTPQPTLARAESVHSVNGHPEPFLGGSSPSFGSSESLAPSDASSNLPTPQVAINLPHINEEQEQPNAEATEGQEETK